MGEREIIVSIIESDQKSIETGYLRTDTILTTEVRSGTNYLLCFRHLGQELCDAIGMSLPVRLLWLSIRSYPFGSDHLGDVCVSLPLSVSRVIGVGDLIFCFNLLFRISWHQTPKDVHLLYSM